MKSVMVNVTCGVVLLVTMLYLCEAQNNRFRSVSSSRRVPSSRFSRTFSDRRQSSSRFQPVRSRNWSSRSSPTRTVSRPNSFRQQNSRFQRQQSVPEQGRQISSIDNLSNAILLSALLGMDMPRDQRLSNQRLVLSHLLGGGRSSQLQLPLSGFSDRGSSSSVRGSSSHNSGAPGSFISSLPGHNLIVQSQNQPQQQPLVIEAGGQIQVQEIKKPDGQTQVVINAGQSNPSTNRATTNTVSTVQSFSTVNPYILSGEDPPEKEPSPLQDVQELAKLLKAMGVNPAKATATVGR
ncbi:uncharacterized protein [Argopecten irradians]|uniref:uncharacterized protein n=1 Tax=Argopecten irradians TaxID=31199 RepID=UPI003718DB12